MAKSKKTTTQNRPEGLLNSDGTVEARPIGQGKDPLAEGARLHNPSNSESETHYKADTSELNAEEKAAANRASGQDANALAEEHNAQGQVETAPTTVSNSDQAAQDEVAEGRVEPGEDPVPEQPETPVEEATEDAANPPTADEVTAEQVAADAALAEEPTPTPESEPVPADETASTPEDQAVDQPVSEPATADSSEL